MSGMSKSEYVAMWIAWAVGCVILCFAARGCHDWYRDRVAAVPEIQSIGAVHVVVAGDTLWSIAERELGDPMRWTEIARLNAVEAMALPIGMELRLP